MKLSLCHLQWLGRHKNKFNLFCYNTSISSKCINYNLNFLCDLTRNVNYSTLICTKRNIYIHPLNCLGKTSINTTEYFDELTYETVSNETLESLNEKFEDLIEEERAPAEADVTLSTGVITLRLGSHGTYVINKQTPNKQIWLSSPFSGPKRYDFQNGHWVYKHDNVSLHQLLSEELSKVFCEKIDLTTCDYGRKT